MVCCLITMEQLLIILCVVDRGRESAACLIQTSKIEFHRTILYMIFLKPRRLLTNLIIPCRSHKLLRPQWCIWVWWLLSHAELILKFQKMLSFLLEIILRLLCLLVKHLWPPTFVASVILCICVIVLLRAIVLSFIRLHIIFYIFSSIFINKWIKLSKKP